MGNTEDPRLSVYRTFSSRRSDPARLCCALTRLSQALAPSVPQAERRIDDLRGVCRLESVMACSLALGRRYRRRRHIGPTWQNRTGFIRRAAR